MQRPITVPSSTLECSKQGSGAVPLVVVCHGLAPPGLDRQSGLGAVERLDLAFLVEREHRGMRRRIEIEADDVGELGLKAGIARPLEGPQPVRLQLVRPPDALHRAHREPHRLGHRPAGPMGRLMRRFGASQRHQLGRLIGRDRRLAGLAGFVAQQALNARFGEAPLPAPHRRPAAADALGNPLCRPAIGRGEHDARPLHVFLPLVAVATIASNRSRSTALTITHTL